MYKDFSAVISVYGADDPTHFGQAMDSLLRQSVLPNEIIVIVDGPIGWDLLKKVEEYAQLPIIKLLSLPENIGLGASRHQGILHAKFEIVAVMDSDDICVEKRFELQIEKFNDSQIDVVGGYIAEFLDHPENSKRIRQVPLTHEKIVRRGHWIQPINHVTLMFRKEAYLLAGGYRSLRKVEDYDLFHRMAVAGLKFLNIREVLVFVRASDEQYARRHGLSYLYEEIYLFRKMLGSGYINRIEFLRNLLIRVFIRLMPLSALRFFSKRLCRTTMLS
jgi:glycosyltransferase involved in cell wall biosynthesis